MADAATPTSTPTGTPAEAAPSLITVRSFLAGLLFAGVFAFATVYGENVPPHTYHTATQIPVLPYILVFVCVLLLNPLLRLLQLGWRLVTGRLPRWCRPLAPAETLTIFVMGLVSSGISTFGLASELVPLMSGLMNRQWNTEQNQWDLYLEPYVNEKFFVAETGLRDAAAAYRDADDRWREAKHVIEAAQSLESTRAEAVAAAAAEAQAVAANDPVAITNARRQTRLAKPRLAQAQAAWQNAADQAAGASPEAVLATFPARAAALEATRGIALAALRDLEQKSFAMVEEFRRGLPPGARAIPGFLYIPGETAAGYAARCHRLYSGTKARRELERAATLLARTPAGTAVPPAVTDHLERAASRLDALATVPALDEHRAALAAQVADLEDQVAARQTVLKILNQRRRQADAEDFERLDSQIRSETRALGRLQVTLTKRQTAQDTIKPHFEVLKQVAATRDGLRALAGRLRDQPDSTAARDECAKLLAAFNGFDASYRRFLVGDIPWRNWLWPLANWTVLILLTYLVLMAFNVLIFRQWARNEKLIYPLAELPVALAGAGEPDRLVPEAFRRGLFWAGFAISAGAIGWNLLVYRGYLPGLQPIRIISESIPWDPYINGSRFQGLSWGTGRVQLFFTLLGLAFLIPANISGSLTLFHLLFMLELLVLVWLGHGDNMNSFPASWNLVLNFKTAQGGGALLIFATVILWKCRQYLLCVFRPQLVQGLPRDEQQDLRVNSGLFVFGSLGLIVAMSWGLGVNLFYAIFYYLVILVITIGLVRAVAEGGVLGFQAWFGPTHLGRTVVGMDKGWTAPSFFAPIMIYNAVLFLDIKTFIAPAMANAVKIRDDLKLSRLRFHLAIWGGILAALLVALLAHVIMGYQRTGDQMNGWFYGGFPPGVFSEIRTIAKTNPVDTAGGLWWLISGVVAMGLLLYLRRHVFWLPHPIGMVMLVNPIMGAYWLNFFLGWIAKTLVTKYGNKDTYQRLRYLFIGLIAGEIVMCLFGHSLNRN